MRIDTNTSDPDPYNRASLPPVLSLLVPRVVLLVHRAPLRRAAAVNVDEKYNHMSTTGATATTAAALLHLQHCLCFDH